MKPPNQWALLQNPDNQNTIVSRRDLNKASIDKSSSVRKPNSKDAFDHPKEMLPMSLIAGMQIMKLKSHLNFYIYQLDSIFFKQRRIIQNGQSCIIYNSDIALPQLGEKKMNFAQIFGKEEQTKN